MTTSINTRINLRTPAAEATTQEYRSLIRMNQVNSIIHKQKAKELTDTFNGKSATKTIWNWIKTNKWKSAGIGAAIVALGIGAWAYLSNKKEVENAEEID